MRTTWPAWVFTISYALLRLYWALGGRSGYSACSMTTTHSRAAYADGCGADQLASLPLWRGWGAVAACALLAAVLIATTRRPGRTTTIAAALSGLLLIALAFPLHLLIEIPAALTGRPSDWPNLADRTALLTGGLCFAAAALRSHAGLPGSRRTAAPVPLSRWSRGCAYGAAAAAILGFSLPHALWFLGVPAGISAAMLHDARADITTALAATLVLAPALAGVLCVGLARPWGRVFPRWLLPLAGRRVPAPLALVPAGIASVALTSYGVIGLWLMGHAVLTGSTTWTQLARDWAVTGTEVTFFVWGVCLGVATTGYYRATRRPPS